MIFLELTEEEAEALFNMADFARETGDEFNAHEKSAVEKLEKAINGR